MRISYSFLILACSTILSAQELKVPSFEEVISLQNVGNPSIAPEGDNIVYTVRSTNWEENTFDTELWLAKDGLNPLPLTNTLEGSSSSPAWSPDGSWISFLADRGEGRQIHVINVAGGEARAVTHEDGFIGMYRWSPDGTQIAFTLTPETPKAKKDRKERYGAFEVDDEEYELTWLYKVDFSPSELAAYPLPCREKSDSLRQIRCGGAHEISAILDSVPYTITNFEWSPDGQKIAFSHRPDPLINSFFQTDIAVLDLASGQVSSVVSNLSMDQLATWSPDGEAILYYSAVDNMDSVYYANDRLFIKQLGSSDEAVELLTDFDEDFRIIGWNQAGIFFIGREKTDRKLYLLQPESASYRALPALPSMVSSASLSPSGKYIGVTGRTAKSLDEVYVLDTEQWLSRKKSFINYQIASWAVSDAEVITWNSYDGTSIEGVLHKPHDYDPAKKYPLMVIIHGGPTGISVPTPVTSYVYPVLQWLNKGALVLQPNYRGSAGYGKKFRALNVRNLGVGDAWDVLSGVDYLAGLGQIDTTKIGCMGWSQGGYISAFLTTTSDRFKAVSVGAGISNWMTYYVNTDIHPFTIQYLQATPWDDPDIYAKTSPMTFIQNAKTPTLIQHGEFDRRVPIPNAYELLQGLRDQGVESKLIVYKGFGHGISKPKERLAATWHNWQWFGKYLWGEDIEIPLD